MIMKENNSPLENVNGEHKMLLQRQKMQQNKWIKSLKKIIRKFRNNNDTRR